MTPENKKHLHLIAACLIISLPSITLVSFLLHLAGYYHWYYTVLLYQLFFYGFYWAGGGLEDHFWLESQSNE